MYCCCILWDLALTIRKAKSVMVIIVHYLNIFITSNDFYLEKFTMRACDLTTGLLSFVILFAA